MDARAGFRGSKACAEVHLSGTGAVIGVTLTLAEGRAIPVDARAGFGRPEPYAAVHLSVNDMAGG